MGDAHDPRYVHREIPVAVVVCTQHEILPYVVRNVTVEKCRVPMVLPPKPDGTCLSYRKMVVGTGRTSLTV